MGRPLKPIRFLKLGSAEIAARKAATFSALISHHYSMTNFFEKSFSEWSTIAVQMILGYLTFLLVSPAAASQRARPREPPALRPARGQRHQHNCA